MIQLESFAKTVLQNSTYPVKYLVYAIEMDSGSIPNIMKQREVHLEQIAAGVEKYKKQGKKFFKIAEQYTQMGAWLKKRSSKTLAKIELLGGYPLTSCNRSGC